jgi:hypothetical protein
VQLFNKDRKVKVATFWQDTYFTLAFANFVRGLFMKVLMTQALGWSDYR